MPMLFHPSIVFNNDTKTVYPKNMQFRACRPVDDKNANKYPGKFTILKIGFLPLCNNALMSSDIMSESRFLEFTHDDAPYGIREDEIRLLTFFSAWRALSMQMISL